MEYLKIGSVVNTFGIKGELKIYPDTDFIDERFATGNKIYIEYGNNYEELEIKNYRIHKGMVLLSFKGLEDINQVEKYKKCNVFFDKYLIHNLKEGEYYFFQLEELEVYNQDNEYLGIVKKVESGAKHNNLRIVMENRKNFLVPFIPVFIKDVDLLNKKIIINQMEGLIIDEN